MKLSLNGQIVTIFGGTGFVGRNIVTELLRAGARVKIATRHVNSAYFLHLYGGVGMVSAVPVSYRSEESINAAIDGSTMVINCLGTLKNGSKNNSFSHIHSDVPVWIAHACLKRHISHFVHISALGIEHSHSQYAISKIKGEFGITSIMPNVTILRPSVIFGKDDDFFNRFAKMAKISPILPLIGGGNTRFQPVYVGDVALATVTALCNKNSMGKIYELGGPEVLTFKETMLRLLNIINKNNYLLNLPWVLARVMAMLTSILPNPPITGDQITSLQNDVIVGNTQHDFSHLGIKPRHINAVLPLYIKGL